MDRSKRLRAILTTVLGFIFAPTFIVAAFADELHSPVYIDYNTYISRQNVLELVSVGDRTVDATISVYRNTGQLKTSAAVSITSLNEFDVLINDLVNQNNTYGLVKIEFDDVQTHLAGRMSVYRTNASTKGSGDYSFAFAKELQNPIEGTTYVMGNTYDAQGRGFLVANWLEISNLDDNTKTFTHNLYDQEGTLLSTELVSVPTKGKVDVSSGHERGQGVYLNEIIPTDSSADYLASVTRYASNARGATSNYDYAYAYSAYARRGEDDTQYAFIENRTGSCYEETSWVEIANVASTAATATLTFYDQDGSVVGTTARSYPAKSQFHFNGSSMLRDGHIGWVKVESDTSDALLVQSAVYFHSCSNNNLQTSYLLPAQTVIQSPLVGSYNRFLNMEDELLVIGATPVIRTLNMTVRSAGQTLFTGSSTLHPNEILQFRLDNGATYGTSKDSYGTVLLDSQQTASFVPFVLRTRRAGTGNKTVDFVLPTLLSESPQ